MCADSKLTTGGMVCRFYVTNIWIFISTQWTWHDSNKSPKYKRNMNNIGQWPWIRNKGKCMWREMLTRKVITRTTRTSAFWGYPPPPHGYPYYWVILDPKSKEDKVKVTNLKNLPKFQNWILKQTLHATHLLKLLDKMCKYEMDPTSIVEVTERTRFCPQTDGKTDRRTNGRTDGRTTWSQYTPLSTSLKRGYKEQPFSCMVLLWVQIVRYVLLADRIRWFVHYTISFSSLCKLIWRHWTIELPVIYILSSVWVRLSIFSQLSII